MDILSIR